MKTYLTLILLFVGHMSHADNIIVDGSTCTLGDAIQAANTDMTTIGGCVDSTAGADTLILTNNFTALTADTIRSSLQKGSYAALPDITTEITIQGGGSYVVQRDSSLSCSVLDAPDEFRLLQVVAGGHLTLDRITLENGCSNTGAAVLVINGHLNTSDTIFLNNHTLVGNSAHDDNSGGALYVNNINSNIRIEGSTFSSNLATGMGTSSVSGGAVKVVQANDLTILATQFLGNSANQLTANGAQGGALYVKNTATIQIISSTFRDNQINGDTSTRGGAVFIDDFGADLTIEDTRFENNSITSLNGDAKGGAMYLRSSNAVFERLIFKNNTAMSGINGTAEGGAFYTRGDVSINNVYFSENQALSGGALNALGGALHTSLGASLTNVTFYNNTAQGADSVTGDGSDAKGGAIFACEIYTKNVTLSNNQAIGGNSSNGTGGNAEGGGLYSNCTPSELFHMTNVGNQSIAGSGNIAQGMALGGGLSLTANHDILSSIIQNNTTEISNSTSASDCEGSGFVNSLGYNHLGNTGNCSFMATGDQTGIDASLYPLADYDCHGSNELPDGTCLPTHAIDSSSMALDQGSCSVSGISTDARGKARLFDYPSINNADDGCDVGAYEIQAIINTAPVMDLVEPQSVELYTQLNFIAVAQDTDMPSQTLSFSLVDGASGAVPNGAMITTNGEFSWIPNHPQALGQHTFDVVVTDNGSGNLSDSVTVSVTVTAAGPGDMITVDGINCTLDDAIEAANLDMTVGGCVDSSLGQDTIILDSPYTASIADTTRSTLQNGSYAALPDITSTITIQAGTEFLIERHSSLACVVLNAADEFRLLQVVGGFLTLNGMTLQNGCSNTGGAVLVIDGHLSTLTTTFTDNQILKESTFIADNSGGAIFVNNVNSYVELINTNFINNHATAMDISTVTGGAIKLTQANSLVIGGALFLGNSANQMNSAAARGGALYVGNVVTVHIYDSVFRDNHANGSQTNGGAIFFDSNNIDLTIFDTVFEDNSAESRKGNSEGGAIYLRALNAMFENLIFKNNTAQSGINGLAKGGAVVNYDLVTINNSYFTGNQALTGGQKFATGGALHMNFPAIFNNVTFDNNLAQGGDSQTGNGGPALGGALYGCEVFAKNLTLSSNQSRGGNSTNNTGGNAGGGGMYLDCDTSYMSHVTIVNNSVVAGVGNTASGTALGGGVFAYYPFSPSNSIIQNNTSLIDNLNLDSDCHKGDPMISLGYNHIGDAGNCDFMATGDQTGMDALVYPLADNGCEDLLPDGTCLPTHAIDLNSSAIDQGSCTVSGVSTDARGKIRPYDDQNVSNADDGCDVGAFEYDHDLIFKNDFE